jgi:heme A synthase
MTRYSRYAWGILIYNLVVILWGAYVRASGSGAGCGSHWPLCNGEVIPRIPQIETLIEFTHRMMSGAALILVISLVIWTWRIYPARHPVRLAAGFSMFFMVTEALVGAGLVLFQLVAENASIARALSMSVHLVNTFLLLASLSLTAWWSSHEHSLVLKQGGWVTLAFGIGIIGMLILGISGAVTALGDTLFPATSFIQGLRQELSATAHFLIRLRILHPTIAIIVSTYLILLVSWLGLKKPDPPSRLLRRILTILVVIQLLAGMVNVFLLAPIWLQIVHLLLADSIWIFLVILYANTLAMRPAFGTLDENTAIPVESGSAV